MKTTTIQKWGNSYAVRIPHESIKKLKLKEGNAVRVVGDTEAMHICIVPVESRPITLKDLVADMSSSNSHGEFSWGGPIGREIW